eukprot:SAG31_NODE_9622_length_1249_cov_5.490435_1_plen_155_part_00
MHASTTTRNVAERFRQQEGVEPATAPLPLQHDGPSPRQNLYHARARPRPPLDIVRPLPFSFSLRCRFRRTSSSAYRQHNDSHNHQPPLCQSFICLSHLSTTTFNIVLMRVFIGHVLPLELEFRHRSRDVSHCFGTKNPFWGIFATFSNEVGSQK